MPLFEYLCEKCSHAFEVLTSASAAPPRCPACSAKKTTRQLSTFSPLAATAPQAPCGAASTCGSSCRSAGTCPYNP